MHEFQVEKMSCGGCAGRVTKAIQRVDHAAQVDIDLPKKQVRVISQTDANLLAEAIAQAGYPVMATTAGTAEK